MGSFDRLSDFEFEITGKQQHMLWGGRVEGHDLPDLFFDTPYQHSKSRGGNRWISGDRFSEISSGVCCRFGQNSGGTVAISGDGHPYLNVIMIAQRLEQMLWTRDVLRNAPHRFRILSQPLKDPDRTARVLGCCVPNIGQST